MKRVLLLWMLVFAAVAGIVYGFSRRPGDAGSILTKAMNDCGHNTVRSAYVNCVYRGISRYGRTVPVGELMSALARITEKGTDAREQSAARCHDVAHVLGRVSYARQGIVSGALASCTPACSSGCFHGVLERAVSSGGSLYGFVQSACTADNNPKLPVENRWACYHGMGHAVASLTASMAEAMGWCGRITGEDYVKNCDYGVLMELYSDESGAPASRKFPDNPASVCETVTGIHRRTCYVHTGIFTYKKQGEHTAGLTACSRLPEEFREECAMLLGSTFFHDARGNPADIHRMCSPDSLTLACMKGAVEESILAGTAGSSGALCGTLEGIDRQQCRQYADIRQQYRNGNAL